MVELSEEKEKELVERVELRFALADDSEKLEKNLDTFLAPLLLKFASPHPTVRQLVFDCVKNIISRVNSLPELQLPVEKLILQAKNPNLGASLNTSNVRLYSLLLASKGVGRLDSIKQKCLVPLVMEGISSLPTQTSARAFHILCKLLLSWMNPLKGSKEEDDIKDFLKLRNKGDLDYLLEKFTQFFLLLPLKPDPETGLISRGYTCPGLSSDDVAFFTFSAGVSFNKEQIHKFKYAIFKFVTHGLVQDDQILIKFLTVVSADKTDLSDSAISMLKTLQIPYEQDDFIDFLISLYTGNRSLGRPPVTREMQEKVLTILNRSVHATSNQENVSLICSIGLNSDSYKLRSLCLTFIGFVAQHNYQNLTPPNSNDTDDGFKTNMASLIRNNLHTEGWPKLEIGEATPVFRTSILQRRQQYETLGVILKKDYSLVSDLSFIEFLFDSLLGDLPDFRTTIQETMVALCPHLYKLPIKSKENLKSLLKKYLSDDSILEETSTEEEKNAIMSCRYVCIKYINATYDFDDSEARLLNIFGTSRINRFDIIEEATKGLHPYWFRVNRALINPNSKSTKELLSVEHEEMKFPDFENFVKLLLSLVEKAKENNSLVIRSTLATAIRFAKQTLISQATFGKNNIVIQDEDWSLHIERVIDMEKSVGDYLKILISSFDVEWFSNFLLTLGNELFFVGNNEQVSTISKYKSDIFGTTLLLILRYCSSEVIRNLEPLIEKLYGLLSDFLVVDNTEIRTAVNILGIISSDNEENGIVQNLINSVADVFNPENQKSYINIYANSYILPRIYIKNNRNIIKYQSACDRLLKALHGMLENDRYRNQSIIFLNQVAKFGLIDNITSATPESYVVSIFDRLSSKFLNNENSVELLGYLTMYVTTQPNLEKIFKKLVEIHTTKHIEVLFVSGGSMSVIAGAYHSAYLTKQIDINCDIDFLINQFPKKHMLYVLENVLKLSASTKPTMRKAGCVWLLSLVQYLSGEDEIKNLCKEIHFQLMKFLVDRDEFIQELASQGLGMIYELGNKDLQEDMIKSLLKSFTKSTESVKIASGSISADTELFDEGMLNTGDGSIRTYKDILSLASEVGDPSLVYQFMSLSKSASIWSSRKGIAFGLGAIISKQSLQQRLLNDRHTTLKLIPKLYRYRFDPYSTVAQSMNDIWNALIANPGEIIKTFIDEILKELLDGMGNKEWRVREASTVGLLNLVQTQPQQLFLEKMLDMWTMGFRTMDDVKESVREAGTKLTTFLSKILVKSIDINKGVASDKSKKILEKLLPFFMGTKGLESDAEPVRNYALEMLMGLVKDAPSAIIPFSPRLVYDFTLLFSSIEPQVINYLALNASNYNIDMSAIDAKRRSGVTTSPLLETIEKLISNSTSLQMDEHINNAIKAIRKSVGLPSKIAASTVVILLIKRYFLELKPYGGKLLKACFNCFDDRNVTIQRAFANTVGHVYKIVPLDKSIKYAEQLSERYFKKDDDSKIVVGTVVSSILKYAPSAFESIAGIFMPLLFIGSNDSSDKVKEIIRNTWIEATASGAGTMKLYLDEILNLLYENMGSPNYGMRKTCAYALTELCQNIADNNVAEERQIEKVFQIAIGSLKGRSWDGKDLLVAALSCLVLKFPNYLKSNPVILDALKQTLLTELGRTNERYVKSILISVIESLPLFTDDDDLLEKVLVVIPGSFMLNAVGSLEDKSSEEQSNKRMKRNSTNAAVNKKSTKENFIREEYIDNVLIALAKSNSSKKVMNFVINELIKVFSLNNDYDIYTTWRSQLIGCEIGKLFVSKYDVGIDGDDVETIMKLYEIMYSLNTTNESTENVKLKFIQYATELNSALKKGNYVEASKKIVQTLKVFHNKIIGKGETGSILEVTLRDILSDQ